MKNRACGQGWGSDGKGSTNIHLKYLSKKYLSLTVASPTAFTTPSVAPNVMLTFVLKGMEEARSSATGHCLACQILPTFPVILKIQAIVMIPTWNVPGKLTLVSQLVALCWEAVESLGGGASAEVR